ncbi:FAD-binding domain-containing protein [Anthocerotibacter panamensis]|uniref:FAD-binding domain-containing protein n=1 Tax=Anthocerotibacter panamensis TaxID=2857077 RepID=UPI001C403A5B|nr:FAD-binding domain-containing protein [Anthocerotibacter panamensis]
MSRDLRRDFTDRADMITYLQEQFPAVLPGPVPETPGGRKAALGALRRFEITRYGSSRNYLRGAVSRLSPYIRYGVLSLAEVRHWALAQVDDPRMVEKFIQELGWRDYWQRVYQQLGDAIWEDLAPYKTGFSPKHYAPNLPEDIPRGTTGLVCIDSFSAELHRTGYLHNHARMWLAAYVVHWRTTRWQAGALWFLEHLLDGDPASNNLSWQWVASTYSQKPYFFNRENLERYTEGVYCRKCPRYGHCPFEGSYERLSQKLFPHAEDPKKKHRKPR